MKPLTALVLAGSRAGGDPLAAAAGVSHKALLEVHGATMIERVVAALAGSPAVGRIVVAIERAELLDALPGLQPAACATPWTTMPAADGPSATVAAALATAPLPLLVTTADHALLQSHWVDEFLAACPPDADLATALAGRADVQAAAPASRRTWLRFADGNFSGCNLFLLSSARAVAAVELWRTLEQHRKQPLALMGRLGWRYALRYRLGLLTRAAALARFGQLTGGARLALVVLRDGRAAIDVDKPADLQLARQLAVAMDDDAAGAAGAAAAARAVG